MFHANNVTKIGSEITVIFQCRVWNIQLLRIGAGGTVASFLVLTNFQIFLISWENISLQETTAFCRVGDFQQILISSASFHTYGLLTEHTYRSSLKKQTHRLQVAWYTTRDWIVAHSLLQSWVQVHVCFLFRNNSYSLLVEETTLTAEKLFLIRSEKETQILLYGGRRSLHSSHSHKFIFRCDRNKEENFSFPKYN